MKAFDPSGSSLEGHQLIEASAGTGKTTAVSALYLRLLLEQRFQVREILVITFTNAATEELRTRIRQILRRAQDALENHCVEDQLLAPLLAGLTDPDSARLLLLNALRTFDEAAIFTIHGFCQKVLQENAFESSALFDTILVADSNPLRQEIQDDYWRTNIYEAPRLFQQFVFSENLNPEALLKTVGRVPVNPYLHVIPQFEKFDEENLKSMEMQLGGEFERLRDSWTANRDEVANLLSCYKGLKRNIYKEEIVRKSLEEIELYLSSTILFKRPLSFSKFCPETLEKGTKAGFQTPQNPFFQVAGEFSRSYDLLNTLYKQRLLQLRVGLFEFVRTELKLRARRQNMRFFDDLLMDLFDALHQDNGLTLTEALRERYKAVLVDEFQDTDPIQYFILSSVFRDPHFPLFLIGDPKQAIYGFRGADVFTYMRAAEEIPEVGTLEKNWRSSLNLVTAVNTLFRKAPRPFVFDEIQYQSVQAANDAASREFLWERKPEAAPLKVWFVERPPDKNDQLLSDRTANVLIPRAVANEILSLLEAAAAGEVSVRGNPLSPADLAILVRTNGQACLLQQALQEKGIPALLYTNESVFATQEALEVERVLRGIAEVGNESRVRAALTTDLFGLRGDELAEMEQNEILWDEWLRIFAEYRTLWLNHGLLLMSRTLLSRQKVRSRLLPFLDGERRLTNLLQIFELLYQAALENHLGMEGLLTWLADRRHENQVLAPEEHQLRLETDEKAVKVITVHKSKGLEFPVVFCPFGWDGPVREGDSATFHDPADKSILVKDLGSEELSRNEILAQWEALSENARLLYVALTRAQYRCYLVWGAFHGATGSALTYLLCPPVPPGDGGTISILEDRFKNMKDTELKESLLSLVRDSQGTIELLPLPQAVSKRYSNIELQNQTYCCRRFTATVPSDWGITSFTSLVTASKRDLEFPDRDTLELKDRLSRLITVSPSKTRSIFEFPRGIRAGNVLHEILECLDFTKSDSQETRNLIRDRLGEHGFDVGWEDTIHRVVQDVVAVPLGTLDGPIYLAQLAGRNRLHEIEFTFPIESLTSHRLKQIIKVHAAAEWPGDFLQKLEELEFSAIRGWLKGFIDLVFQHGPRFYLIDWKSNYLGNQIEAYRNSALQEVIQENFYFLQYDLYTLALHRYLRLRIPNYQYDSHFGGVFYIFLRGIHPGGSTDYGVFHDRPSESLIRALDLYFLGTESARDQ